MLSRLSFLRATWPRRQAFPQRFKSTGWADGGDHATYNDMPVPEGDWADDYNKKNIFYNIVLLSGITALGTAIGLLFFSGVVNFNYSPPEHWRDEGDFECECEDEEPPKTQKK